MQNEGMEDLFLRLLRPFFENPELIPRLFLLAAVIGFAVICFGWVKVGYAFTALCVLALLYGMATDVLESL